jgi:hypothetical protein
VRFTNNSKGVYKPDILTKILNDIGTVQNAQMSTSSSSSIANGWFILHFEDLEKKLEKDILYLNNTKQSISDAARQLERTIFERFGRLGDPDNGEGFRIESLSLVGPDLTDLQVTFSQLVTYIRDLPASPKATKPDLFGLGSNKLQIKFEYIELQF